MNVQSDFKSYVCAFLHVRLKALGTAIKMRITLTWGTNNDLCVYRWGIWWILWPTYNANNMLPSFLFLHAVTIALAKTVLTEFIICNLFFSVIKDKQVISVHLKNNGNINIPKPLLWFQIMNICYTKESNHYTKQLSTCVSADYNKS